MVMNSTKVINERRDLPPRSAEGSALDALQQPPWVVFTGGPCSGKSTTANLLKELGYNVVPEIARLVIRKELTVKKCTADELFSKGDFVSELIWEKKLALENRLPKGMSFIFDRALPDSIVYYELAELDPSALRSTQLNARYRHVFLFEPLPFIEDGIRTSDEARRTAAITQRLGEVYSDLGYQVTPVPVRSIEERLEFMLQALRTLGIERRPK